MLKREFGTMSVITDRGFITVDAVGTFEMYGYRFAVHHSVEYPDFYGVSEMSSGRNVCGYVYECADEAFERAVNRISQMRAYLATSVGKALVYNNTFLNNGGIVMITNCLL